MKRTLSGKMFNGCGTASKSFPIDIMRKLQSPRRKKSLQLQSIHVQFKWARGTHFNYHSWLCRIFQFTDWNETDCSRTVQCDGRDFMCFVVARKWEKQMTKKLFVMKKNGTKFVCPMTYKKSIFIVMFICLWKLRPDI